MGLSVFQKLAGTLLDRFRIGHSGPTIFQGTTGPDLQNVTARDGDIYIEFGDQQSFYQRRNGVWIDISTPKLKRTVVDTSSYTINTTDSYIGVNYDGPVDMFLPAGAEAMNFIIKDEGGFVSSTNRIRIFAADGELIEGDTDAILDIARSSVSLVYGSGWHII